MQIDVQSNRCSGCRLCQQICAIHHFKEINPKKSALRITARFPEPGIFAPVVCDQCGECEHVCPAGAIEKRGEAYMIDISLCSGCGECVEACAKGVIHIPRGNEFPIKCDSCMKCVEVCNTGAIQALERSLAGKEALRCTDSGERPFA